MHDVVIIGAGPAGLTAALYAGRSLLKTRLLEKLALGGQVLLTETIENFPGLAQMNSFEWVELMKKQVLRLADVKIDEEIAVERIETVKGFFRVHAVSRADQHAEVLDTKTIILSTGAQAKRLGIKGEEAFIGRGVSFCATCDGPLFRDKELVVVGGGDTAIEEAIYLTKFARKVLVVHRRSELRATAILQERAKANQKISFCWDSVPVEIAGKARVERLMIKNVKTGAIQTVDCDGVFVFIGVVPDTGFVKGHVDINESGYIVTDDQMMSSCPGIFAAGDCRARPLHQVVTACSDGAIAAHAVNRFLQSAI